MAVTIRPMRDEDVSSAAGLWATTWSALETALGETPRDVGGEALQRSATRYRYLLGTDPGGCFVAEHGEALVGLAVSHVRGERFLLANLAVAPSAQGKGIGRALLGHALQHGASAPVGLICSSPDPRALHRYLRAGFQLSPAMEAIGRPSSAVGVPGTVRRGDPSAGDLDLVDALDQHVRRSTRREDVCFLLESGAELWVDEKGAYALARADDVITVCATADRLGRRLLAALLSGQLTGRPLKALWLTAADTWAFGAASDAGATLKGHGAVMTRGALCYDGAYLLSGALG